MRLSAADRRLQIQSHALELFASRGFQGTTTRQIAQRCGVNESILFRHFPTKEHLYWAVLDEQCAVRGGRDHLRALLDSDSDDATVFANIAEDILRRNTADTKLSRLLLFSALENHKLSHRFFRTYISEYYDMVAARIVERIRTGRFRKTDPLLAARSFIGMVFYHFLIQELFGGRQVKDFDVKAVSATLTSIWLSGITNSHTSMKGNGKVAAKTNNGTSRKNGKNIAAKSNSESSNPYLHKRSEKAEHLSR